MDKETLENIADEYFDTHTHGSIERGDGNLAWVSGIGVVADKLGTRLEVEYETEPASEANKTLRSKVLPLIYKKVTVAYKLAR